MIQKSPPSPCSVVHFLTVILLSTVSVSLLHAASINDYFQSYDFVLLKWASTGMVSAFRPTHWEFYRPITVFAFAVIYKLASLSPPAFRLVLLSFQLANCILLSCLALKITRDKTVSIVAPVLFAFSFYHCEVLLWVSCLADVLATFFCILTLLFYIAYRAQGGAACFVLSVASFSCAVFSKESAIPLFPALIIYDYFMGEGFYRRGAAPYALFHALARYAPFAAVIAAYTLFKTPAAAMNPYGKIAVNYTQYVLYAFLPFLTTYTYMSWPAPVKLLVFVLAAGGISTIVKRGGPPMRFLVICFLILLLPPAVCTVAEARYLFMPGCFTSIVLASALVNGSYGIARRMSASHRHIHDYNRLMGAAVLVGGCLVFIIPQALFVFDRGRDWASASAIAESIIGSVRKVDPDSLAADAYFVNLPDGIPSKLGCAYIFRNGIAEALYLAYGGRVGRIEAVRMPGAEGTWRGHVEMSAEALQRLGREGARVFIYNPHDEIANECRMTNDKTQ